MPVWGSWVAVENPLLLSLLWQKRKIFKIQQWCKGQDKKVEVDNLYKSVESKGKETPLSKNSNLAKQTDVVRWHLRELRQPSCRAHQLGSNGGSQDDRDVWGDESHSRLDVPEMCKLVGVVSWCPYQAIITMKTNHFFKSKLFRLLTQIF